MLCTNVSMTSKVHEGALWLYEQFCICGEDGVKSLEKTRRLALAVTSGRTNPFDEIGAKKRMTQQKTYRNLMGKLLHVLDFLSCNCFLNCKEELAKTLNNINSIGTKWILFNTMNYEISLIFFKNDIDHNE